MQSEGNVFAGHADPQQNDAQSEDTREEERGIGCICSHMAYALGRDYTDLFHVNMETGEFVEYRSDDECGVLVESRRADGFFESCAREAKIYIHPDDRDLFVDAMNREFLTDALDQHKAYGMTYRRIKDGKSFYVQMRVTQMKDDKRYIVVVVSDIDELVERQYAEQRVREERIIYARLHAIAGNHIVVYVVDPKTDRFREFSSTEAYMRSFTIEKEGEDFFERSRKETRRCIHPLDLGRFLTTFSKENILAAIKRDDIFTFTYRLMMEGKPLHVQMKAAMVEESGVPHLIVGIYDIDTQVRQEKETEKRLAKAQAEANVDALTGVRNKHAYLDAEERLNDQIAQNQSPSFAVVVMDVNDLKRINDTDGHQAGDHLIREACHVICNIFKHSPVYRVGGDEFAVIAQGVDYAHIEERLWDVYVHNEEALRTGGIVIACGMARSEGDNCVADVFDRADQRMYDDKEALKSRRKN